MGGERRMAPNKYPQFDNKPRGPEIRHLYNDRLNLFCDGGEYSKVNLHGMLTRERMDSRDHIKLEVYSVPHLARPLFKEAIQGEFLKAAKGQSFGPSWSTHWFRITITSIPKHWIHYERVQFEFDLPEGLVYSEDGVPLQGLTGGNGGDRRVEYILPESFLSHPDESHTFYIETSMNGMFGTGEGGLIQPPNPNRHFTLNTADLVAPNMDALRLFWDFWIIKDISRELPQNGWESHQALKVANAIMNTFQRNDNDSILECRKLARTILGDNVDSERVYDTPGPAFVTAIGHCHIDTAWLWPFAETKRKIARSWATQVDLIKRYPEHRFTCSQAQQYKWLSQDYPKLYRAVSKAVKEGKFEPIGGTWVEMDTNMPSGESLVRQFLFGQRYFERNFGKRCSVFWLPDTFGYSSQLPQLAREAGMKYFFTQKLSWNNINDFPHSTFNWQALDGTQVLTHMAPDNTYTAQADIGDTLRSEHQHKNLTDDRNSLLVFGNGDGGGGPLAAMFEKLRRSRGASDTGAPSLPRVTMGRTVSEFYEKLEIDSKGGRELRTWTGELYFELHRGTYTSQALTKRNNRVSEILLHEIEYWGSLASIQALHTPAIPERYVYPRQGVNDLWEDVLLCQFHDVLPGSSIEMVYFDAHRIHANVLKKGAEILQGALTALGMKIDQEETSEDEEDVVLNTLSWNRTDIVEWRGQLIEATASDTGPSLLTSSSTNQSKKREEGDAKLKDLGKGCYILSNSKIAVTIDNGCITSFLDIEAGRNLIPPGCKANQFIIYEDMPLNWQAWDVEIYHTEKADFLIADSSRIISLDANRVSIEVKYTISQKSWITSTISLNATPSTDEHDIQGFKQLDIECICEWHESQRFLKVAFPVSIHASAASYESQFGINSRPTHFNTTWDAAKFEVVCHRWADLSEFGYGVAILNDSKYGFATQGNVMNLSLLRSPKAPDAHADMGRHVFKYAMLVHDDPLGIGEGDVVRAGFNFNNPLKIARKKKGAKILKHFTLGGKQKNVILDTIKMAEDSDDIVLRLYEAYGGAATTYIMVPSDVVVKRAWTANLLEETVDELKIHGQQIKLCLRPFQVQTVVLRLTE